jgi:hypothetical protein
MVPHMAQAAPLATALTQRKKTYLKHNPGEQAAHIARRHAVHKRSPWMHAPAYWRLDLLRALCAKGHREGAYQRASLPLANIHTRPHTRKRWRQPPAEDDKLFTKQTRGQRGVT